MKIEKNRILQTVLTNAKEVFPDLSLDEFKPMDYFTDLGASSVDRALLVDNVLGSLALDMPMADLVTADTISELVELIFAGQSRYA